MTPDQDIEDEVLGRWLAGELSEDERLKFESTEAFKTYQAIAEYAALLEVGEFDTEGSLSSVQSKIKGTKEAKIVKMKRNRFIAIAASVLILIGVGSLFLIGNTVEDTTISTALGEQKNISLPDHSTIALNANSTVKYNKETWEESRNIELKGEAFFDVQKGKAFSVTIEHGKIEVLGTTFNILDRNDRTEVVCYSGKVRVTDSKGNKVILTKGEAAKMKSGVLMNNWSPKVSEKPNWQLGFSEFENVALVDVIEELEAQYNIQVNVQSDIRSQTFHGTFPHDDIDQALVLVFGTLQMDYVKENDGTIVVK